MTNPTDLASLVLGHCLTECVRQMHVVKRNGKRQPISFDKVTARLHSLAEHDDLDSLDPSIDCAILTQKVVRGMYNGIKTR